MATLSASRSALSPARLPHGAPAVAGARWTVRLLGAVEAIGDGQSLSHWPTRAVAALLARLALEPDRVHSREELIELLWPEAPIEVGRNRLRQALCALKGLLEPPGPAAGLVLQADRIAVRVMPGMIDCDVLQFAALVRSGDTGRARALYRGELMPGFYDDWVVDERHRLAALVDRLEAADQVGSPRPAPQFAPSIAAADVSDAPADTGLPSYWTRSFGIEKMTSRLRALVLEQRLVTVHGPGGSGKTRLAVAVARSLRDATGDEPARRRFDRIAFVALVDCTGAAQALDAIRGALHIDAGGDAVAAIFATLAGRRALLVLDNLEQLADEASAQIAQSLRALPDLHVLATSRRLLRLDGEVAFEIEGLRLPAPETALADAAINPAVALFVDRTRAARADFRLSERNADAIVALVRLLGGMPLAIELAASRVRAMSAQTLLHGLSSAAGTPMLDLLARGAARAAADTRHASMRHMVAWSWQHLTPAQQQMLRVLSVFAAPVRPEMVAAAAAVDLRTTQSLLDELHAVSLVQPAEVPDGVTRFALLQPVREFAGERTSEAAARSARGRSRQWLIAFARQAVALGPAAVATEIAHVHAAIVSAPGDGDPGAGLALAVALRPFWDHDMLPLSDLLALEQALHDFDATAPLGADPATLRGDALELLAYGRATAGFAAAAVDHAEAALALAQDDRRRSIALVRWVWSLYTAGRYDDTLEPTLVEAAALARRSGDLAAQASVLRMQAVLACNFRLDYAGAEALGAQAQQLWERLGDRAMVFDSLVVRATMWAWLGREDQALTVFESCERAARAASDWVSLMVVTRQTGRVYIRMRRWDDAVAAFCRSVRVGWQRHYALGLAHGLLHLPEALVMCGQTELAARLQGFAVANWSRLYHTINRIEARELRRTRLLLHQALGTARAEALRAEGTGLDIAEAVELALGNAAH